MTRLFARLAALAALSLMAAAPAAWAVDGPPTPDAFPLSPIARTVFLSSNSSFGIVGATTGKRLGVTSLTMTNFASTTQQINLGTALTRSAPCVGSVVGGGFPNSDFLVPARQTLHVTFPTPLVIPLYSSGSCLKLSVTTALSGGSVEVLVNGYQQ